MQVVGAGVVRTTPEEFTNEISSTETVTIGAGGARLAKGAWRGYIVWSLAITYGGGGGNNALIQPAGGGGGGQECRNYRK